MAISFHSAEDQNIFHFKNKLQTKAWLKNVIKNENHKVGNINYVFCTDNYLLTLNQKYLNHDTFTDIITFDYSEKNIISGDIYISIDRIKENANNLKISFEKELNRVMVHGALHLMGYKDKKRADKDLMTTKEDFYLKEEMFHVKLKD
jgi:probable rRNA maturation factor